MGWIMEKIVHSTMFMESADCRSAAGKILSTSKRNENASRNILERRRRRCIKIIIRWLKKCSMVKCLINLFCRPHCGLKTFRIRCEIISESVGLAHNFFIYSWILFWYIFRSQSNYLVKCVECKEIFVRFFITAVYAFTTRRA